MTAKQRRQRRLATSATAKERRQMMGCNLSEELRERYEVRSLGLRKGDTVKIRRGDFAGIEGKVVETDPQHQRVIVEGVTREKVSGEQKRVPVHVSKVTVTGLDTGDKWRSQRLERRPEEPKSEKSGETA